MTAAASLSSAFITDAIADFKGRLDTLMEESLTKYREKAISFTGDDYTEGYGAITVIESTPIPPGFIYTKGVWFIHYCYYVPLYSEYGQVRTSTKQGSIIDNYGNLYNYNDASQFLSLYGRTPMKPVIGDGNYKLPLPNYLIDAIKLIPNYLGEDDTGPLRQGFSSPPSLKATFLSVHILPLVKLVAESAYKSRQATLHLQRELAAEKAKMAALEAEIRRLKATAPPTEDLLGLNVVELAPLPTLNVVEVCPT